MRLPFVAVRPLLFWILLLLVLRAGGSASADEESDRKDLLYKIDGRLDYAASELSGLESDSDASDVDDALSYIREVEGYVEQLSKVKGSDSTANNVVSTYPGYIRDFRAAAEELKKLKGKQRDAAKTQQTCKAFDQELTTQAQAAKDEPKAAESLRELAKSVGRKAEDLLRDADAKHNEVARHRDEARRFSASDGKWSSVRSNMQYSIEAIYRSHYDDYQNAKRECEEPVKRERHREVEKALGRLASSTAGRADLQKKIEELLVTIGDRVKDAQSHSGTSYVNGAVELTKEVESQLERLRYAQGDDAEAKRIAYQWSYWVRELRPSLEALREMKTVQNRADESAGKCDVLEKALQDKIRAFVADPTQHESALRSLPPEADQTGAQVKSSMDKAAEVDRQIDGWLPVAKAFGQSEGTWARISSQTRDSADRIHAHWKEKYGALVKSCERLALGAQHPDVKKAIEEMSRDTSNASQSYRALRDEFNRWKTEVDKLRDWTDQDVEAIRQEFCKAPDAGEYKTVIEVAERWANQLRSLYGTITGMADSLKRRADELVYRKRALKAAPKTKEAVDRMLESIAKVKDHHLLGSNNPMLKAQADYGVTMHKELQRDCQASEITISGSYCTNPNENRTDCRIDCVIDCRIIEIKPSGAAALGRRQAEAYANGLRAMFQSKGKSMFEGAFARFEKCLAPDKSTLLLEEEVRTYQFCPAANDVAPKLERADPSIPQEAE